MPWTKAVKKGKQLNWFSKDSVINYDYGLLSAYYFANATDVREKFGIKDDFILYGDSGGYQQLSLGQPTNPTKVYEWQKNNVNVGFIKDFPISPHLTPEQLKVNDDLTMKNAKLAYDLHNNGGKEDSKYNMELWGVVHGTSPAKILEMKEKYDEIGEFDGFAIGSLMRKNRDVATFASFLGKTIELLGVKKLHLLGFGSMQLVENIYEIASKHLDLLSFDSSSVSVGARYRSYKIPYSNTRLRLGRNSENIFHDLPCGCPVCELYDDMDLDGKAFDMHNLFWKLHEFRVYKAIRQSNLSIKEKKEHLAMIGVEMQHNVNYSVKGIL